MEALRDLVDAYAVAADDRETAAFAELFAEQAWLEARGHRFVGREAIADIPARLARYERTLHLVSTHRVRLVEGSDPPAAEGVAYCEAHHRRDGADHVQFIRYRDAYVVEGGRWRFASRIVEVLWEDARA